MIILPYAQHPIEKIDSQRLVDELQRFMSEPL
jgi:hypothetical protein